MYLGGIVEQAPSDDLVRPAAAPVHDGADVGRARSRTRRSRTAASGSCSPATCPPGQPAARLPVPHPLPVPAGDPLRRRAPAAAGSIAPRAPGRLPLGRGDPRRARSRPHERQRLEDVAAACDRGPTELRRPQRQPVCSACSTSGGVCRGSTRRAAAAACRRTPGRSPGGSTSRTDRLGFGRQSPVSSARAIACQIASTLRSVAQQVALVGLVAEHLAVAEVDQLQHPRGSRRAVRQTTSA